MTKLCKRCEIEKSVNDFRKYRGKCKMCENVIQKERSASNTDKQKAVYRKYNAKRTKESKIIAYSKRQESGYAAKWQRDAYAKDSSYRKSISHRKRALSKTCGEWTQQEWLAIKKRQNYKCLMCGCREPEITLTVDHVVALSKGGANVAHNLQGLCKSCNSRKGAKTLDLRSNVMKWRFC